MQIGLAGRERTGYGEGALPVQRLFPSSLGCEQEVRCWHLLNSCLEVHEQDMGPTWLFLKLAIPSPTNLHVCLLQEDARTDAVDSVVRDIQNTQCLLNVEHLSAGCPHVTLQFADSKGDVGLGLVKEGLVMVEVRKEKQFQKVVCDVGAGSSPLPTCHHRGRWGYTKSQ